MKKMALWAVAATAAIASPAAAQTIVSATSAVINAGGPGFGSINDTFNQNGLLTNYTSGVTNFNSYIAGNPQHNLVFSGNEWFSNSGTSSAQVTYDLGAVMGIDALALWNEDIAGIGLLNLFGSADGVTFGALGSFTPTNNTDNANYGADVFTFAATSLRYVRFDMSRCPQAPGSFDSCAIGEVAFRTAQVGGGVPEPATWAMMLLGFGALGGMLRRQRSYARVRYAF